VSSGLPVFSESQGFVNCRVGRTEEVIIKAPPSSPNSPSDFNIIYEIFHCAITGLITVLAASMGYYHHEFCSSPSELSSLSTHQETTLRLANLRVSIVFKIENGILSGLKFLFHCLHSHFASYLSYLYFSFSSVKWE
jgi:hypothetical protein